MTSVHSSPMGAWTFNSTGPSVEERLDYYAYNSRYTEYESPEVDEDKEAQVASLLQGLSPVQLSAAETHGIAGLSFAEAARVLGKNDSSVSMAWYRVVERATGETPSVLEKRRAAERSRTRVRRTRGVNLRAVVAEHGKIGTYSNHGCRCIDCVRAHTEYSRKRKQAIKAGKIAEGVRLRDAGVTLREAAKRIGTSTKFLRENVPGGWSGPELTHGLVTTYDNYRCRCDECKEAARLYRQPRRKGKQKL